MRSVFGLAEIAELKKLQNEYDEAKANARLALERHGLASAELRAADRAVTAVGFKLNEFHSHAGTCRRRQREAYLEPR
jgi:hypothetical protein